MKFLSYLTVASAIAGFSSCGILTHEDDSPSGRATAPGPTFGFTGPVTTNLETSDLRARINGFSFLQKLAFANPNPTEEASYLNRGTAKNFKACVQKQINSVPLAVTSDTVSYLFEFDFIALCDNPAKDSDLIDSVSNTMKASVVIGCAGGSLAGLEGKQVKDLTDIATLCKDSQSQKFSYDISVAARKAIKTKKGTESEVTSIESYASRTSLDSGSGPCVLTVTDQTVRSLSTCTFQEESKSFHGAPKFEQNSPIIPTDDHAKEARPVVMQTSATIVNATLDSDPKVPFYTSATTTFTMNGWKGEVKYGAKGWTSPTWTASKDSQKADGTIGSTDVTNPAKPIPNTPNPVPAETPNAPNPVPDETGDGTN